MWSIPYTDNFWDRLLPIQWQLFAYHLVEDKKESEEQLRDIAEYAMAFHNYDAVQAVRDKREQESLLNDKQSQDIFMQQVEQLFGRKLTDAERAAMGAAPQENEEDNNLDDLKIIR